MIELTEADMPLYEKARQSLLFDDLLDFVISKWPLHIDTSSREYVDYVKRQGSIEGLYDIGDDLERFFEKLEADNLFVHLNWSLSVAVHQIGLMQNTVYLKDINREYVKFRFEDCSISRVIEEDISKIPPGIRDDLDFLYDIDLVVEYYKRNYPDKKLPDRLLKQNT